MGKGSTESPYTRTKRKEIAFKSFARGYANVDIARKLRVTEETVSRYRREYETKIEEFANEHPDYLQKVLAHTLKAIDEVDQVRSEAWKKYASNKKDPDGYPLMSEGSKAQYLKIAQSATDQKSKLLGLLGVSQEYHANAQRISAMQARILEFMSKELCQDDRAKLERYLRSMMPMQQIEAQVIEATS